MIDKLSSGVFRFHLTNAMIFSYAAVYLGELHGFYELFTWWDLVLHFWAGASLFHVLHHKVLQGDGLPHSFLVTFGMAASLLTSWEIFEFLMDYNFDLNMQKDGIQDTMEDLIVGKLGAFMVMFVAAVRE